MSPRGVQSNASFGWSCSDNPESNASAGKTQTLQATERIHTEHRVVAIVGEASAKVDIDLGRIEIISGAVERPLARDVGWSQLWSDLVRCERTGVVAVTVDLAEFAADLVGDHSESLECPGDVLFHACDVIDRAGQVVTNVRKVC